MSICKLICPRREALEALCDDDENDTKKHSTRLRINKDPDAGALESESAVASLGFHRTPPVYLVCTSGPAEGMHVAIGATAAAAGW